MVACRSVTNSGRKSGMVGWLAGLASGDRCPSMPHRATLFFIIVADGLHCEAVTRCVDPAFGVYLICRLLRVCLLQVLELATVGCEVQALAD